MVKVGRRFFFNQNFQKKQRRITIFTIIGVIVAILLTFTITSYFHDNSGEKGKLAYTIKDHYDVEVYTIMPSYLNYFEKLENVPIGDISIQYDDKFSYEENGDNCSDEELELIRKIRLGEAKEDDKENPFACLNFVPNKVGTYAVKIKVGKEENVMDLNIIDTKPPVFTSTDITITNEETYTSDSFITSCNDNSKEECYSDFYIPLRGERVDYSKFQDPGEYEIKVVAKDKSGNTAEPQTVTLTIKKVNYYTITFNTNGGDSIESATVREGDKIHSPYPSKDGYTFEGWYNGNSKYNFEAPVTSNITLTAKWKKNGSSSYSGGYSGSGYSGGSGGSGSSNGCQYGKFSDYTREVSLYANVLHGKGVNDCAEKNNSEDYAILKDYVLDIAYDLTERNKGAIDLDMQNMVGAGVNINHSVKTTQIVNSKGGLSGVLVEITSSAAGYSNKYTLYNCTTSSCKWR